MSYPMAQTALNAQIDDFVLRIKRRQLEESVEIARTTTKILRQVVSNKKVCSASALMEEVRTVGKRLMQAKSIELTIGNMVRRVLYIIREEDNQTLKAGISQCSDSFDINDPDDDTAAELAGTELSMIVDDDGKGEASGGCWSLRSLLDVPNTSELRRTNSSSQSMTRELMVVWRRLKHNVIDSINEFLEELGGIRSLIAEQAPEHIHSHQTVLTFGRSVTTLSFLKEAVKRRQFSVVVAEASPGLGGHQMAKDLSGMSNILQTTVIADAAVFAMMSRVNLVVVGARALLSTGGIIGHCGLHALALAAQRHAVPFVVLIGLHKLSPEQPMDPEVSLNDLKSPAEVADFEVVSECMPEGGEHGQLQIQNPSYDYVPPHLISLFITDSGGHSPSYVYRLLAEYYSPEDHVL